MPTHDELERIKKATPYCLSICGARAYLISRANRLVPVAAHATHHYNKGTHDVEASPSSMSKEPIVIDISDNEE